MCKCRRMQLRNDSVLITYVRSMPDTQPCLISCPSLNYSVMLAVCHILVDTACSNMYVLPRPAPICTATTGPRCHQDTRLESLRLHTSSISLCRSTSLYGLVIKPSIHAAVAREMACYVTSALTAITAGGDMPIDVPSLAEPNLNRSRICSVAA